MLLPLGWTERRQFQINGASGQSVRHFFHQEQIGGAGENEIAGATAFVHGAFDREQKPGRALNLIQDDRPRREQRVRIPLRLIQHAHFVQGKIRARRFDEPGKGGLAGLPCASQHANREHPQGRLQILKEPTRFQVVHAVQ